MIVGHVSLYRTCTNAYVSTYVHVYVHQCVISLYILYSTLLYCVHLNDSAMKDVNDERCEHFPILHPIRQSIVHIHLSHPSFTIPILHERSTVNNLGNVFFTATVCA